MWDKLEKLEILLYQQQNVIAQLLAALITSDGAPVDGLPYNQQFGQPMVEGDGGQLLDEDFLYEDLGEIVMRYHQRRYEKPQQEQQQQILPPPSPPIIPISTEQPPAPLQQPKIDEIQAKKKEIISEVPSTTLVQQQPSSRRASKVEEYEEEVEDIAAIVAAVEEEELLPNGSPMFERCKERSPQAKRKSPSRSRRTSGASASVAPSFALMSPAKATPPLTPDVKTDLRQRRPSQPQPTSVHEKMIIDKSADKPKKVTKVEKEEDDIGVFTAKDYVNYHEEDNKSLVSDHDIESLLQMDRLFGERHQNQHPFGRNSIGSAPPHLLLQQPSTSIDADSETETTTDIANWLRENEHQVRRFSGQSLEEEVVLVDGVEQKVKKQKQKAKSPSEEFAKVSSQTPQHQPLQRTSPSPSRRTSVVNSVELLKSTLESPTNSVVGGAARRDSSHQRPSLVKESKIYDEHHHIHEIEHVNIPDPEAVQVRRLSAACEEPLVKMPASLSKEKHIHPQQQQHLLPETRPKSASVNLLLQHQMDSDEAAQLGGGLKSSNMLPGQQPQHRRFNSLEEKNILSSITSSVKAGYQNVFSRSSLFRRDNSKEQPLPQHSVSPMHHPQQHPHPHQLHSSHINAPPVVQLPQHHAQPAHHQQQQSNIKDSLKNIWGGFKSLQESSTSPKREDGRKRSTSVTPTKHPQQMQMSMPELQMSSTQATEELMNLDVEEVAAAKAKSFEETVHEYPSTEGGDVVEMEAEEEIAVAIPNREPLVKTAGEMEFERKKSFRMQHSMQEANTMMDTLKVQANSSSNNNKNGNNAEHGSSSKNNKLEKSFSDESAIFSFTPSSRQSGSEQEALTLSEQMSSDSMYGDGSNRARSASNHLPVILDKADENRFEQMKQQEGQNSMEVDEEETDQVDHLEEPQPPTSGSSSRRPSMHNNFAMIMKAKSEEPSYSLRRCLTLSDKSESEEAGDILGEMQFGAGGLKPPKRSRTKWIAAAVSTLVVYIFSFFHQHFFLPNNRVVPDKEAWISNRRISGRRTGS